jgi:hypothetical protein
VHLQEAANQLETRHHTGNCLFYPPFSILKFEDETCSYCPLCNSHIETYEHTPLPHLPLCNSSLNDVTYLPWPLDTMSKIWFPIFRYITIRLINHLYFVSSEHV